MHCIIKVLVGQVPHQIQRPWNLLGPLILTLGKTFNGILNCVDQDNVAVGHVVEINPCRALPGEYLHIHVHHHKLVPLSVITDRILFPDISEV